MKRLVKDVVRSMGKSVAGESEKRGQMTPFIVVVRAKKALRLKRPRIKWCCILLLPS